MEPLSALSLASAVLQIVDFSAKVMSSTKELYLSTDGKTEEDRRLYDATRELNELMETIDSKSPIDQLKLGASVKRTADAQLVKLAKESQAVASAVHKIFDRARYKKDGRDRSALEGFPQCYDAEGNADDQAMALGNKQLFLYQPGRGAAFVLRHTEDEKFTPVYAQGDHGLGIGGFDLKFSTDYAFAFDWNMSGNTDHLVFVRPGYGTIYVVAQL